MRLEVLVEPLGEDSALAWADVPIGLAWGFLARRSYACLRFAVGEFSRSAACARLTAWRFAFAGAAPATQALVLPGIFCAGDARPIVARGPPVGRGHRRRAVRQARARRPCLPQAPACAAPCRARWR
jgi:hypothetical protein